MADYEKALEIAVSILDGEDLCVDSYWHGEKPCMDPASTVTCRECWKQRLLKESEHVH